MDINELEKKHQYHERIVVLMWRQAVGIATLEEQQELQAWGTISPWHKQLVDISSGSFEDFLLSIGDMQRESSQFDVSKNWLKVFGPDPKK